MPGFVIVFQPPVFVPCDQYTDHIFQKVGQEDGGDGPRVGKLM